MCSGFRFKSGSTGALFTFFLCHLMWVILSMQGTLILDRKPIIVEQVTLGVAYVLQYAYGVFYLFYKWNPTDMFADEAELKKDEKADVNSAVLFTMVFMIGVPLITSGICLIMKFTDDKQNGGDLTRQFWVFLGLTAFNLIAEVACLFVFVGV